MTPAIAHDDQDMPGEIDFSGGTRGKFHRPTRAVMVGPWTAASVVLGVAFGLLSNFGALARAQVVLRSAGGGETITISCHPLDIRVSQPHKLPVVSPPIGGPGRPGQANVTYAFDGQGPFNESWDATHEGVSPAQSDQINAFLAFAFTAHVLHFATRDGNSIEYRLDPYADALKGFVRACSQK